MNRKTTSAADDHTVAVDSADEGTDWDALATMSDAEVEAAARADPDAQPMTADQLRRARRVGLHGSLRFKLKLGREEFARRYHVPIDTLRGWERGTIEPDAVALAYLRLIDADPEGVARLLAEAMPAAAE